MLAPVMLAANVLIANPGIATSGGMAANVVADTATPRASSSPPPRTLRVPVSIVRQRFVLEIDPRSPRWSGSWGAELAFSARGGPFELRLESATINHAELHERLPGAYRPGRLTWGPLGPGVVLLETYGERPGHSDVELRFDGAFPDSGTGLVRDAATRTVRLEGALGRVVPALAGAPAGRVDLTLWVPRGFEVRTSAKRTGRRLTRGATVDSYTTTIGPGADTLRVEIVPAPTPGR